MKQKKRDDEVALLEILNSGMDIETACKKLKISADRATMLKYQFIRRKQLNISQSQMPRRQQRRSSPRAHESAKGNILPPEKSTVEHTDISKPVVEGTEDDTKVSGQEQPGVEG